MRRLAVISLLCLGFVLPASAQAGSYTMTNCSPGQPSPSASDWPSANVNAEPPKWGGLVAYVNHNKTQDISISSSQTNLPRKYATGSYIADGGPSDNPASVPWQQAYNYPEPTAIIPPNNVPYPNGRLWSATTDQGRNCGYNNDAYYDFGFNTVGLGMYTRVSLNRTRGAFIEAMGNGGWGVLQLQAPVDGVVNNIDANLRVWSAARGCTDWACLDKNGWNLYNGPFRGPESYPCFQSGTSSLIGWPGCAASFNQADLYWQARFYSSLWSAGYGYDGSGQYQYLRSSGGFIKQYEGGADCTSRCGGWVSELVGGQTSGLNARTVQLFTGCHNAGGCVGSWTNDGGGANLWWTPSEQGPYQRRAFANLESKSGQGMNVTMSEGVAPGVSLGNVSRAEDIVAGRSPWITSLNGDPDITVRVNGSDPNGAGVSRLRMSFDSGPDLQPIDRGCNPYRAGAATGRCLGSTSGDFSFKASQFSNGAHTVYGTAYDDAGNTKVASNSFNVDNEAPGTPPGSAGLPHCPSGLSATSPTGALDGNGREWLRATVLIEGSGCDRVSGLQEVKMQYQTIAPANYSLNNLTWGSSWTDAPSCVRTTQVSPAQASTIRCNFDTSAFPEGTAIRFRWRGVDLAGNIAASDPSGVRYLDNTAPTLSNMRWEAYDDRADTWEEVTTGWTNAKKTRLRWNAISAGNGSPIDKYFYLYDPDPEGQLEGTTSGSCAAQQPNGWLSAVGVTLSEAFNENRAEQCRQGKHQAWIWVRDVAGNGAEKPDKSKSAGTSTVKYDSVPTPESREESWSKSETLAPQSFRAYPGDDAASVGKWTRTNLFTLAWTNPAITNVRTQSPILKAKYQVGGGSTLGDTLKDVQEYTGCLVAGQSCTISGIKAPSEGSHPVRMWLQDAAGNSSLEQSSVTEINYRDGTCVQP